MKTRQGFVSNSSSSSFVIVGAKLTKKLEAAIKKKLGISDDDDDWQYEKEDEIDKLGISILYTEDTKDGCYTVGKILADVGSDGDFLETQSYSIDDLNKMAEKVRKVLGDDVDVKLMMGTRPS
jgi:hypothetical protein